MFVRSRQETIEIVRRLLEDKRRMQHSGLWLAVEEVEVIMEPHLKPKNFLERVYSLHPLTMAAGLCLLLLALPASVLLWREAAIAPGATERAIDQQGDKTRTAVLDWMTTHVAPVIEGNPLASNPLDRFSLRTVLAMEVDRQVTSLQDRLEGQIAGTRKDLFDRVDEVHISALKAFGATLTEIDKTRDMLDTHLTVLNHNAAVTMDSASNLMDTYAAIPDRFAQSPAWKKLEPEITCVQSDGSGYGGCWHGRVTALLGESVKVGGTFTQKFPQMADAVTGMAQNGDKMTTYAQRWMAKNVDPHPTTKKEKLESALKISITLLVAALRGGAI